ncbi:hypothetical protein NBRC116592_33120 [Colwellia sp. KU-HH00111]|uniref:glycosyltransferase n=1 Tax=Colwellia sp. KU-HH00111 TaxID=3127652 RepID=UPI00310437DD
MKILRVLSSVDPRGGGPIESVIRSSMILEKDFGCSVELASLDNENSDFIKNIPLKTFARGKGFGTFGLNFNFLSWLYKKVHDYDIVIIEGLWQFHGYAARKACLRAKKPYVVYVHGMLASWFRKQHPLKHLKKSVYWLLSERITLKKARYVIFTNPEEKEDAKRSFWPYELEDIVLNFGTTQNNGNAYNQQKLFLDSFPMLKNRRVVLFMGRIDPIKGIDILCDAFIKNKHNIDPSLCLVIAGPDTKNYKAKILNKIPSVGLTDKIIWTGMLKDDLKWGAIKSAEVFLLPSHQESFGVVVAEALSCSVPVLISNKVNIHGIVSSYGAGLVAEDTLAGISKLLLNWQQLQQSDKELMSLRAKKCFDEQFDIRIAAEELYNVLVQNVIEAKNIDNTKVSVITNRDLRND